MVKTITTPVLSHKNKSILKEEKAVVISKGKIDQIETLLRRASSLEEPKPRKYLPSLIISIETFFCGFSVTSLLSKWFGLIQTDYTYAFWIIALFSCLTIVGTLVNESNREDDYISYTDELQDIINEIKKEAGISSKIAEASKRKDRERYFVSLIKRVLK